MGQQNATTLRVLEEAYKALAEDQPMTVRQVFYRLVSNGTLPNTQNSYKTVGRVLGKARKEGDIPWEWVEDRLRRPRGYIGYCDLSAYLKSLSWGYIRDVWPDQPGYVECWLEKDALSGMFDYALWQYRVWLNVGRGYPSLSAVHNAAQRYRGYLRQGKQTTVLYFGDFDPSGEDIPRALEEELNAQGVFPTVVKVALTHDDIVHYQLPPNPSKPLDSRSAKHIEKWGAVSSVELDALPARVLKERINTEIEYRMDLDALRWSKTQEDREDVRLRNLLGLAADGKTLDRLIRLAPRVRNMNGPDLCRLYDAISHIHLSHDDAEDGLDSEYIGEEDEEDE